VRLDHVSFRKVSNFARKVDGSRKGKVKWSAMLPNVLAPLPFYRNYLNPEVSQSLPHAQPPIPPGFTGFLMANLLRTSGDDKGDPSLSPTRSSSPQHAPSPPTSPFPTGRAEI